MMMCNSKAVLFIKQHCNNAHITSANLLLQSNATVKHAACIADWIFHIATKPFGLKHRNINMPHMHNLVDATSTSCGYPQDIDVTQSVEEEAAV